MSSRAGTGRGRKTGSGSGRREEPARRCCFAEPVGGRIAGCARARKSTRGYRRVVDCLDKEAHGHCIAWLERVRQGSRFALGTTHAPGALAKPAARRLQRGGVLGLGDLLEGRTVRCIDDVSELMRRALVRYRSLDEVPLEPVVRRLNRPGDD